MIITDIITDVTKAERVVERLSQSHKELQVRAQDLVHHPAAIAVAPGAGEHDHAELHRVPAPLRSCSISKW